MDSVALLVLTLLAALSLKSAPLVVLAGAPLLAIANAQGLLELLDGRLGQWAACRWPMAAKRLRLALLPPTSARILIAVFALAVLWTAARVV
jgi:hypothetical protein